MMKAVSIEVVLNLEPRYPGDFDSVRLRINDDGLVDVIRFCSEPEDAFTEAPAEFHYFMDVDDYFDALCDEGYDCKVTTDEGKIIDCHMPEKILEGLRNDVVPESGNIGIQVVPKDVLKRMFDESIINQSRYHQGLKDYFEYVVRKADVEVLMADGSYPFVRSDEDIFRDHRFRLITDEDYGMFVWYRRNRVKNCPSGTDRSFKLKLSCEGMRIIGRYDLCEYSCKADSTEMTKRLYCFRGTLFEGCGNVKAPDDATYIELSESRHRYAFQYLNELRHMDVLGKNYRDSPFSSFFFDLYTRYEDVPMMHTKGTADYPYFIKMLMFIIGAENIYGS